LKKHFYPTLTGLLIFTVLLSFSPRVKAAAVQKINLDQALRIALENNLPYRMARDETAIAEAKKARARSGYYPKITFGGGITQLSEVPDIVKLGDSLADLNNALDRLADILNTIHNPYFQQLADALEQTEGPDDGLTYYGLKVRLEQPLYTGGRLDALNSQAQANLEYARANLEVTRQNLIFEVKKAYFTVLQMQRREGTMREAVKSMENHRREAKLHFEAGMAPRLDVLRAEVKLADLKQKELAVANGLELAKKYFSYILGTDGVTVYELQERADYEPLKPDLDKCRAMAASHRIELKAVRNKIKMAEEALRIAKSGNKPVVALVAEGEQTATEPFAKKPEWSLSLAASFKISDGGLVKNQIGEAEVRLEQARTAEQWALQGISLEVEQASRNLGNAVESIAVSQKILEQAKETVHMAMVSYQAGLGGSLERIDAETAYTQAENNYSQALCDYNIALAQLEKALGVTEEELKQ